MHTEVLLDAGQLASCSDRDEKLTLRWLFQGILTNWEVEKTVWDRVFGSKGRGLRVSPSTSAPLLAKLNLSLQIDPSTTPLLLTEPVLNLPNVREHYDQMIFEEYEFASYLRCPGLFSRTLVPQVDSVDPPPNHTGPALVPLGSDACAGGSEPPECVLVVDAGFSFTHVVPVLRGSIINVGIRRSVLSLFLVLLRSRTGDRTKRSSFFTPHRRIDAGGKLLTNHLKEVVSFRQWYMMDQTSVMEHAKEECCYVSEQWQEDWETAK